MEWSQHDRAPSDNTLQVRKYLDQMYTNTRIGRNGLLGRPVLQIYVLDFFMGYNKKQSVPNEL